jgi:hypothetical protein
VYPSQTAALSALAEGLTRLFNEAVDLLPRMIAAEKAGKPLPRRDPAGWDSVCAALSFVGDGRPQFLTLAHLDGEKVFLHMQETLVWIALDAVTCRGIEDHIPEVTRAPGWLGWLRSFRSRPGPGPDAAQLKAHRHVLMRNTQNIAIRAAFLAHFVRFSIEYIANLTPANRFAPATESAQRHFEAYQRDIERLAPSWVDWPVAANLLTSLSFPFAPLIVAQFEDTGCERLNGVPLTREQNAAWLKYFGTLQSAPMIQAAG